VSWHITAANFKIDKMLNVYYISLYSIIFTHVYSSRTSNIEFINQSVISEINSLIALNSNTEIDKSLIKINEKVKQLKTSDITRGD
jgi:hypothetical protein